MDRDLKVIKGKGQSYNRSLLPLSTAETQSQDTMVRIASHVDRDFDQRQGALIYNGRASLTGLVRITMFLAGRVSLWAREEKTMITERIDMAELKEEREKVIWFRREDVERLIPCMRFGIRVNKTLAEMLEEPAENLVQMPRTILNALLALLR